ncbi:hypothetical protein [Glycomyces sp. NPDC048151]|uniref:hypothetical protein n=1 Tax=Glycomyces sp. NPDC048151 TaxID=3364002 RepID=UPI00371EFB4D
MTTTRNPGPEAGPATIVTVFNEEGDDRIEAVLTERGYEVRRIHYIAEIWDLPARPAGHLFATRDGDPYHLELHGTSIWFADIDETCRQRHAQRNTGPGGAYRGHVLSHAEMDAVFRAVLSDAIAEAAREG